MEKLIHIVGMKDKKELAQIQIISALKRGKPFPHTLLHGIGGLGKTKFARAIANELGYHMVERQASALDRDIVQNILLTPHTARMLFFIDECHRLDGKLQEELYVPMVEFRVPTDEGLKIIKPFTMFAATTRMNLLDGGSFITRFRNNWELTRYSYQELAEIVVGFFKYNQTNCTMEALREIEQRSLGVPRTAINLASKAMDVAIAYGSNVTERRHALHAFNLEKIDKIGLTDVHRRYLGALSQAKKALGISGIASMLRLTKAVVEGSIEPILFELGFIKMERGRVITLKGLRHIGL